MRSGERHDVTSTQRCVLSVRRPGTASPTGDIYEMLGEIERGRIAPAPE